MSENELGRMISKHNAEQKTDRRIKRTRDRLGDALIELMQEKEFNSIILQEVWTAPALPARPSMFITKTRLIFF